MSVVLLTWNRERLLAETLESILGQTMGDLEVLLVDNESTDGTQAYVASLSDPRVRYHRHANGGVISVNRNHALRLAQGEYVAFCDDDDVWRPEKLERQLGVLARDAAFSMVATNAVQFSDGTEYGPMARRRRDGEVDLDELLEGWHSVITSSVLVRRAVIETVGLFDEDPDLVTVEDYEYWLRVAHSFRIYFLAEELVGYRVHPGKTSHGDLLQVIDRQELMASRLHAAGGLTDVEYAVLRSNLARNRRRARPKELLKRSGLVKRAYYAARAAMRAVRTGGRRTL